MKLRNIAAPTILHRAVIGALFAFIVATSARAQTPEADAKVLLNGIAEISAPGIPGSLSVFGANAGALIVGANRGVQETVVAFARSGAAPNAGRVVAFGHDGYLAPANL